MNKSVSWPAINDERLVEQLIPAIQQAIAATTPHERDEVGHVMSAPDVANALLFLLASVLESSPACATPPGARKLAEAAGRELNLLIRDAHRIRQAEANMEATTH